MKKVRQKHRRSWTWLSSLGLVLGVGLLSPVTAAERVFVTYSFIELAIPVSDLEIYAREGRLTPTLKSYSKYLKPEQLEDLRGALQRKVELSPQVVSQFLYTPTGERLLLQASDLIKTKSQGSNIQALRSALILAANDEAGLTALSLFRHYPDSGIQLDVAKGLEVLKAVQKIVRDNNSAIAAVSRQAEIESQETAPNRIETLLPLRKSGIFKWDVYSMALEDNRPQRLELTGKPRSYPADIYVPRSNTASNATVPLVVISHGLGSDRAAFRYFAEHLASHGYLVAIPEHPGSSNRQIEALFDGKAADVSQPSEFLDRPLDVSFLIDELLRAPAGNDPYRGRVNPDAIGVMGQSFGGYTALALAGATFDFAKLKKDCEVKSTASFNISLLLQCQVLQLPEKTYALADPRIKGIIAVNPLASLFGEAGMQAVRIPTMVVSGSADTIAPPLAEQIEPFTWLPEADKQLILIEGATHFSTLDALRDREQLFVTPKELVGKTPEVARTYMRSVGLAFMDTYLKKQADAAVMISPSSIQAQSIYPLPLLGINQLTAADLERMRNALW